MSSDFPGAFAALREMLRRHTSDLVVLSDTPTDYTSPTIGPNKKPIWFAAVTIKKSAVTYQLLPLYFNPKLEAQMAPELLPRKQGKACFNFQRPDPELFAKLDDLTRLGREQFERCGMLKPGKISREELESAVKAGGTDIAKLARERKEKSAAASAKRRVTRKKK